MNTLRVALAVVAISAASSPILRAASPATPQATATSSAPFLGRWDLTLKSPDHEYPSWLEITDTNGTLAARLTARWGHARPLPRVAVTSDGVLTFTSPKEEEEAKTDMVYRGSLSGGTLKGTVNGPDGAEWQWVGVPAPSLATGAPPKWGTPIQIFDGKDLAGWHTVQVGLSQWRTKGAEWTVEDGSLVTPGHGPELVSDRKFTDFKLHVEFNCAKDSNSGVFLRGRYETQIETDSVSEPPSHHTGGLYGFLTPTPELPRSPDTWQTFDITLIGRTLTVVHNGQTVIDRKEIPGLTGGALDSDEALPGPIYLQGSEQGHVRFRSIAVTPAVP